MSTYARWVLWVGVFLEEVGKLPESTDDIIENSSHFKPYEAEGLKFQEISMHGEAIGFGVEVAELHWTTASEFGDENTIDPTLIVQAQEMVPKVEKVFAALGITPPVKIRHHIDLGG